MSYETPSALARAYRELGWFSIAELIERSELEPRICPLHLIAFLGDNSQVSEVIEDAYIYFRELIERDDIIAAPRWTAVFLMDECIERVLAEYDAPPSNEMH